MSSLFDSLVRQRRQQTPWARVDAERLIRDLALTWEDATSDVTLTARYRRSVASDMWYTLSWIDEEGQTHKVEASDWDLLLWRAAEARAQEVERRERRRKPEE